MSRAGELAVSVGTPALITGIAVVAYLFGGGGVIGVVSQPAPPVAETLPSAAPTAVQPSPTATVKPPEPTNPVPSAIPTGPPSSPYGALLASVPIAGERVGGYERDFFGAGWRDPDRNGCDARNDILSRDLLGIVYRAGTNECVVLTGILNDPYTAQTISFVRGNVTSEEVQIDHVVPLAWAWGYGAYGWDAALRERFSNDPLNLLAVDGPTNMAKSDSGPSDWMPPNTAYECAYAEHFIAVLVAYPLSITLADASALRQSLKSCTA